MYVSVQSHQSVDLGESSNPIIDPYFVSNTPEQVPPTTFIPCRIPPRSHELNREEYNAKHEEQLNIAKSAKVICSLDLLLQMFQGKCRHPACNDKVSTKFILIGTSVLVIVGSFIPHMIAMVYLQQISKLQLLFYYLATILQKFNSSQDF